MQERKRYAEDTEKSELTEYAYTDISKNTAKYNCTHTEEEGGVPTFSAS